jgi:phosphatidyl-myo-inositol dimannoside synthase
MMKSIDLLVPELFANPGGIQKYSQTLIRALRTVRPAVKLRVFILNDEPGSIPAAGWDGIQWFPCSRSVWKFAFLFMSTTLRDRSQLMLSTHPNFAALQWLNSSLTGVPSWCSAHGIDVWSMKSGLRSWCFQRLQRLLPVSRFTAAALQRRFPTRCPSISILPNCFDPVRFSPGPTPAYLLERYGLVVDQPVLFSLSRLARGDRDKHLDRLIRAMPELRVRFPDLVLIIGGDGEDRVLLQDLASSLDLGHSVLLPGRIPDDELPDHYRLASVFALPSDKEGFGIVFLEALGCGRPVMAGSRDGSRDPLCDGRFGRLVDPDQPLVPVLVDLLSGQGHSLWFDPVRLSAAVADQFAFPAFCRHVDQLLRQCAFSI